MLWVWESKLDQIWLSGIKDPVRRLDIFAGRHLANTELFAAQWLWIFSFCVLLLAPCVSQALVCSFHCFQLCFRILMHLAYHFIFIHRAPPSFWSYGISAHLYPLQTCPWTPVHIHRTTSFVRSFSCSLVAGCFHLRSPQNRFPARCCSPANGCQWATTWLTLWSAERTKLLCHQTSTCHVVCVSESCGRQKTIGGFVENLPSSLTLTLC